MPGHTHLKWQKKPFWKFEKTFNIYQQAKNQLHPWCFPWDIARDCKLVVFGTLGLSGYMHPKWYCHLLENFWVICRSKINFIIHAFVEILKRYAKLFWLLWACLVTLTQNDSITLQKILMFICIQKINFIIHFVLTILHFKESCNLIDWKHSGP